MKTIQTKILFLLFSLLVNTGTVFSSSYYGNMESMSMSNGLNNNTVYDFLRGNTGFIWLSTDMGISRYDGFHFRNFPFMRTTQTSQQAMPNAVRMMYQNDDGLLFLLLAQGEVACFDQEKERYLPVSFSMPLGDKKITGLFISDKNLLYLATTDGLYHARVERVSENKQEEIRFECSVEPLVKGNISYLCGDEKGSLFFCIDKKRVIHYLMGSRQVEQVGSGDGIAEVTALSVQGGYLWVCRKYEDISFYDFERRQYRTLTDLGTSGRIRLSDTYVTDVATVDKNLFYLSTWSGLFFVKFDTPVLANAAYTINSITSVNNNVPYQVENKMTSLLWDDSQNMLWGGTFGGGVVKVAFNENMYSRVSQQIGAEINGVVEDAKGYIWLATNRKGIWKSTTNTVSSSISFVPWTKGTVSAESYQIYKDMNGGLWLGDAHSGILYINPVTEEVRQYQLNLGVEGMNARQFCLDSRDRLWVVTNRGLVLFDNQMRPVHLSLDDNVKNVYAVAEDKEGNIWIGTDIGLKRVELNGSKVKLVGNYEEQIGIDGSPVSSLYVNSYNQIFASYADKIIRIDGRDKNKPEALFSLADGLNSAHIFCMVDDQNGNTWVGSNSGIMTIRNDRTTFYSYSLSGCCDKVCRLRDGRLLWNDSWGLIFFDPLIAKNGSTQKELILSDLWVNGASVTVGEQVNGQMILSAAPNVQDKFVFSANNNDFSFYFSDMQYNMMQRKLAYRLLPDEEWKLSSLENGIHYGNLDAGKYTLQVKLIYPDASEGTMLEVPIVVKQFWWKTGWAVLGYVLLLCGLLAVAYYYLMQKERKKLVYLDKEASWHEKLGFAKTQQEQKKEMDELRNVVMTRFVKELRTPLSMIVSPLREVLQEKELSKGLSSKMLVAYKNSVGMLNAYDQLLAIYGQKKEDNRMKVAPYSLVKFVDSVVLSMNEFLRVHPIEFQYEKKVKKDLEVWIDKKKMEFVLRNLLSNAFFHIRHTGAVALLVQEVVENDIPYYLVIAMDNSKGEVKILENEQRNEETWAEIDSADVELGYGEMEHIAKLHHGTILLENVKEGGTKVQIKCPIDKGVFEGDANVEFIAPEEQEEVQLPNAYVRKMMTEEELDETDLDIVEETNNMIVRDKKTLLIVEDYKDIRLYLKTLFEKEYNILLAVNGAEGVEMARKELPDLIISDVMMPVKDGFECCKEIKEGLDTCHIPVILLTAKVEDDDIVRGLENGADDYVLKPFTPKILKAKVRNLIEGRSNLKNMYTHLLVTPPDTTEQQGQPMKEAEIEDPFISTVVKIIEENIQEPDFNVKKLASDLNMSQPTLYRKVKQCTDFTIIELIRGVRMRKAAVLLKTKQYPVQEVAEMVGYNDIPTFRKHFVDTYGTTPSTYASLEETD